MCFSEFADGGSAARRCTGRLSPILTVLRQKVKIGLAPSQCAVYGGNAFLCSGESVTEVLDYVPASFKVVRHIRPCFTCTGCDTAIIAKMPSLPVKRGKPGPGLLAHVLISKYCDHTLLYQQSEIYACEGVDLSRQTMADWVGRASALLNPLIEKLRAHVLSASRLPFTKQHHVVRSDCRCASRLLPG